MNKSKFLNYNQYCIICFFCMFMWNVLIEKRIYFYSILSFSLFFCIAIIVLERNKSIKKDILKKLYIISIPLYLLITTVIINKEIHTLNYLFELFIITFYIFLIYSLYTKEQFYSILAKYFILTIIASIILCVVSPSRGFMSYSGSTVIRGVFSHKNILARNMLVGYVVLSNASLYTSNKLRIKIYKIFSILAIILIILSKSTTSLLLVISLIIVDLIIQKRKRVIKLINQIIILTSLIFNIAIIIISDPKLQAKLATIKFLNKDLTFTGRTYIWHFSLSAFKFKPLFGYGYYVFWPRGGSDYFKSLYYFDVPHAHNGYINLLLEGGVCLLFLILIIFYKILRETKTKFESPFVKIIFLITIITLIINLIESSFIDKTNYIFYMLMCINFLYIDKIYIQTNKL